MEDSLYNIEPRVLWKHFLELSKIPRGSRNEAAAARYVEDSARAMGHEVIRDDAGNLLIRKKAASGMEKRQGIVIQAHVDMVCEKNELTMHDFLNDPIAVYRDDDMIRARGTTLGADNGIGVAAALAVSVGVQPRAVPVRRLQAELVRQGAMVRPASTTTSSRLRSCSAASL